MKLPLTLSLFTVCLASALAQPSPAPAAPQSAPSAPAPAVTPAAKPQPAASSNVNSLAPVPSPTKTGPKPTLTPAGEPPVPAPLAKVGELWEEVSKRLGKPTVALVKNGNGMANYPDGTRLKVKEGKIVSVERIAPSKPKGKEEKIEDTNIWELSAKEAAAKSPAKLYHTNFITKDFEPGLIVTGGQKGAIATLQKKPYLFLYFSAHWCPPCRAFTPRLVEWYKKNAPKGDFELLFVSSDRSPEEMAKYMREAAMPWTGLRSEHPQAAALKKKFGVAGIPCLVLLDQDDKVVASSFKGGEYLGPEVALAEYDSRHR